MRPVALLLSFLFVSSSLPAQVQEPELTADEPIEIDAETKTVVAKGNAQFLHEQLELDSDEIRFSEENMEAQALGGFRAVSEGYTILGDHLLYNVDEGKITATGEVQTTVDSFRVIAEEVNYTTASGRFGADSFRAGNPPYYLEGESLSGNFEKLDLEEATIYRGEPSSLGLNIQAEDVEYIPGERVSGKNARLRVGQVPVFWLPTFSQRLDRESFDMRVEVGARDDLGAYLQSQWLMPFNEHTFIGPLFDIYTRRGVLIGPAFIHERAEEDYFISSNLRSGFIYDFGDDRDFDILGRPVPENRYFLELEHIQAWEDDRYSLTSNLGILSDSEVERDFRREFYDDEQIPDNFVEGVYRGGNYFVSAFGRFNPNDFAVVQERLPEVRFDAMPTLVGDTEWYHQGSASFARLAEDRHRTFGLDEHVDRLDLYYAATRPVSLTNWMEFVPIVGTRVTYYDDVQDTSNRSYYTRAMGEVGFDLQAIAHAQWDYQNEFWKIDGLRHIVRPVTRYRYLPGGKDGRKHIVPIDDEAFITGIPPIDLYDIRYIDDLEDLNVLRFGVENLLQTRQPEGRYGSRDLVELNVYQDLLFSEDDEGDEWSSLYTQLSLFPAYWFNLDLYQRFDPEDLTLEELQTVWTLTDADVWRLQLATVALDDEIDQYGLNYLYRFNERWSLEARLRFDSKRGDLTRQILSLHQSIQHTWEIEYRIASYSGSAREDETSFSVSVGLLDF